MVVRRRDEGSERRTMDEVEKIEERFEKWNCRLPK